MNNFITKSVLVTALAILCSSASAENDLSGAHEDYLNARDRDLRNQFEKSNAITTTELKKFAENALQSKYGYNPNDFTYTEYVTNRPDGRGSYIIIGYFFSDKVICRYDKTLIPPTIFMGKITHPNNDSYLDCREK